MLEDVKGVGRALSARLGAVSARLRLSFRSNPAQFCSAPARFPLGSGSVSARLNVHSARLRLTTLRPISPAILSIRTLNHVEMLWAVLRPIVARTVSGVHLLRSLSQLLFSSPWASLPPVS